MLDKNESDAEGTVLVTRRWREGVSWVDGCGSQLTKQIGATVEAAEVGQQRLGRVSDGVVDEGEDQKSCRDERRVGEDCDGSDLSAG